MIGIIGFIISFLAVLATSYFVVCLLKPKNGLIGFIYLGIINFAQIILTFEFLSLFSLIKVPFVLASNLLLLYFSIYVWQKNGKYIWKIEPKDFLHRFNNSLKLDKSLGILLLGFIVFIYTSFMLSLIMPVTSADGTAYHVSRCINWVLHSNLNHYTMSDIRGICSPINSEILYTWVLLFIRKDVLLGFFSFFGYILTMASMFGIESILGYCTRRKLWILFLISSFPCVLVQVSGTETDLIMTGLISSSIFLFWYSIKCKEKMPLFVSALAYGIALGTKNTAFILVPGVILLMLYLGNKYKNFTYLKKFIYFCIINFLVFSSYNYVLNFMQFDNFMGSNSYLIVNMNYWGLNGLIASFIKHMFLFIDFTGFKWMDYLGEQINNNLQNLLYLFSVNNIPDGIYNFGEETRRDLLEPLMGAGVLGFLIYLPCLILSIIKPIFKNNLKKINYNFVFSTFFFINLIVMSAILPFMNFSIRFLMEFLVLSSPILYYSYFSKNNPLKYITIFFELFSLIFISNFLLGRSMYKTYRLIQMKQGLTQIRNFAYCKDVKTGLYANSECLLSHFIIKNYSKNDKILIFLTSGKNAYSLDALNLKGYNVDFGLIEDKNNDIKKYNLIIFQNTGQNSTYILNNKQKSNTNMLTADERYSKKTPCLYLPDENLPNEGMPYYAYESRCIYNKWYIDSLNFKQINKVGIINPLQNEYSYYMIFKNENKPLY